MNAREFLDLALAVGALRFGEYTLKSGRISPYFFNAGAFCDGIGLDGLGRAYARALLDAGLPTDMLFGPAYKGIPLVAVLTATLARDHARNLPYAYDRKEAKDHGEGGRVVGAPLRGRVLIVDDVISAGTSVRASVELIRAHGATPAGVLIALDRQERGQGERSAVQEVEQDLGLPVIAVARLTDLFALLGDRPELERHADRIAAYRARYAVA
jgi:orotate phosphoribosyltransferase